VKIVVVQETCNKETSAKTNQVS